MTRNYGKCLEHRVLGFLERLPHSVATLSWNTIAETCLIWTFSVPDGGFVNYLQCRTAA